MISLFMELIYPKCSYFHLSKFWAVLKISSTGLGNYSSPGFTPKDWIRIEERPSNMLHVNQGWKKPSPFFIYFFVIEHYS